MTPFILALSGWRLFIGGYFFNYNHMSKKSFLLYVDALTVLNELNDEQAGQLFKAITNFQNGTELNPFNDPSEFGLRMAFLPFKNQFARDAEKYNGIIERNKENGKKGGRPKKENETEKTQPVFEKPKKAVNVNDNDNVNDNELLNNSFEFNNFWSLYDKKTDRARCLEKWKKVFKDNKQLTPEVVINSVKQYVNSTPDPKFRKNPLTWLNGNCWEDETGKNNTTKKYIPTL